MEEVLKISASNIAENRVGKSIVRCFIGTITYWQIFSDKSLHLLSTYQIPSIVLLYLHISSNSKNSRTICSVRLRILGFRKVKWFGIGHHLIGARLGFEPKQSALEFLFCAIVKNDLDLVTQYFFPSSQESFFNIE